MTSNLRAQTTIPTTSGLADNVVVWTTHWRNNSSVQTKEQDAVQIQNRIFNFITSLCPTTLDSSYGFSSSMRTATCFTDVFDLEDPKPRVAFSTASAVSVPNPVSTGQDLPPEVALCISYQGVRVSGKPQNRRRGRLYFGPIQFMNNSVADHIAPGAGGCDLLATKFISSMIPGTADSPEFAVLSRQTWAGLGVGEKPPPDPNTGDIIYPEIPGNLFEALAIVDEVWCDNAWDTQRRRGVRATVRSSHPALSAASRQLNRTPSA